MGSSFFSDMRKSLEQLEEAKNLREENAAKGLSTRIIPSRFRSEGGPEYFALNEEERSSLEEDGIYIGEYEEPSSQIVETSSSIIPGLGIASLYPKSSQTIKDILPPPASIPKRVPDTKSLVVKPLVNILDTYIKGDELYKKFNVSWGAIGAGRDVTIKQMEDFAQDYLITYNQHKSELKYIDIISADTKTIVFRFAVERWLYDNFNGVTPTYRPIASLEFPFKVDIPYFFYDNTNGLRDIIISRFKVFMSSRKNKLLNKNFSFLKAVDVDMFEYKMDLTCGFKGAIIAGLRHTVAIGALAIYTSVFFNKKLTSTQEEQVKKSASRFSDTDNLNRFLKNLK